MWQSASRVALMCVFLGAFRSSNRQGGIGARLASSCAIAGYDSGVCWESERLLAEISYCADVVQYKACGPQPPTDSSFNNVTIKLKDEWVRQMTETIIEERIAAETNDLDINEYGDPGFTVKRFSDGAVSAPCSISHHTSSGTCPAYVWSFQRQPRMICVVIHSCFVARGRRLQRFVQGVHVLYKLSAMRRTGRTHPPSSTGK